MHTEEAAAGLAVRRSPHIDEIPVTLAELERPGEFGTDEWWSRQAPTCSAAAFSTSWGTELEILRK
jgi:hypothetical protein